MQLRRKATQKKGPTTEPRTHDLHSNVEFHPRELQNRSRSFVSHCPLYASHGCATSRTAKDPRSRGWHLYSGWESTRKPEMYGVNSTVIPLFVKTEFEWQPYCCTCWPFCLPSQAPECISIQMTLLSITRCFCYGLCHCVWHKLSAKTPKDRHVTN